MIISGKKGRKLLRKTSAKPELSPSAAALGDRTFNSACGNPERKNLCAESRKL